MEIHPSARKHEIADDDIEHATGHALAIDEQDDDTGLHLGPSRSADLIEVVEDAGEVPATPTRRLRMAKKTRGRTASGVPIADELVAELAEKAEAGYNVDELLRRRGGRPPLGSAPATVESVRLDPELRDALAERARRDEETPSSIIRKALRTYLDLA